MDPEEAKLFSSAPHAALREHEDWLFAQRKLALDTGGYYAAVAFEKAALQLRAVLDLCFGPRPAR